MVSESELKSLMTKCFIMEELNKKLTEEEIKKIGKADDFHIAPFREDGKTYGTPTWIWSVAVDGNLYCRAYSGKESRWYKAAMSQKAGKILGADMERKVRFEPVTNVGINKEIDEAYKTKYAGDEHLEPMISEAPKNATVKITSFN